MNVILKPCLKYICMYQYIANAYIFVSVGDNALQITQVT